MSSQEPLETILENLTREQLLALARNEQVPPRLLEAIARQHSQDEEIVRALIQHPSLPPETISYLVEHAAPWVAETISGSPSLRERLSASVQPLPQAAPQAMRTETPIRQEKMETRKETLAEEPKPKERKKDLYTMIKALSTGQRLALAKKGNKEVRMILIRDPNEMVALEVLSSPRITDAEIVQISSMKDVSEKILRAIGSNRKYRSNKTIVLNLLHNPKTPVSVSLGLGIPRLSDKELAGLARDRNIPGVIARAAATVLEKRKKPPAPAPGKGH